MRVERLQQDFEIDVEWRPFELHPELPVEGKELGARSLAHYQYMQLATAEGLAFQVPARVPNSHRSLEAAEFAREHRAFTLYHRALFEAYFSNGSDIGDVDVLTELAASCDLDPDGLRDALHSGRYAALVDQRTDEARGWGVTGTPTFVFEAGERRFALVGAQDYAVFESIAHRMGATPRFLVLGSWF